MVVLDKFFIPAVFLKAIFYSKIYFYYIYWKGVCQANSSTRQDLTDPTLVKFNSWILQSYGCYLTRREYQRMYSQPDTTSAIDVIANWYHESDCRLQQSVPPYLFLITTVISLTNDSVKNRANRVSRFFNILNRSLGQGKLSSQRKKHY